MTDENKVILNSSIKKIKADGGTDIALGMKLAFKVLENRKYVNNVTSVFLLSDGLDGGAENKVK